MKSLRLLLAVMVATYMTGTGYYAQAQETNTSPFSITLSPVQYASVKGNVGKFRALNWMKDGADGGISDMTFIKDINKDVSLDMQGSAFAKTDNYDGQLTLKDGDLAFLNIDYRAFRKYYDNTGGVYPYTVLGVTGTIPAVDQGAKPNSPDLQMDVSFFKLEAGLGPISDPFLDVVYQHNSKNGDKSLLQWTNDYLGTSTTYRKIGPSWESVNNYSDTVTLKEKKDIAGITIKGEQNAEIDYNNSVTNMQYLNGSTVANNQLDTLNESPDAKLFGAGVRVEKWMFNDKTFAGLGYHYNHTHDTDSMQQQIQETVSGVLTYVTGSASTLWNFSQASEDEHVFTGNLNTKLTPDLTFIMDGKYEHMGSEGGSTYYVDATTLRVPSSVQTSSMANHDDNEGEHVSLRYSGLPHTSLYTEGNFEEGRNWTWETFDNSTSSSHDFFANRINYAQKESWAVGGDIIPNRFFTITTQVKQHWEDNTYNTLGISSIGVPATDDGTYALLDALNINGVDATGTLKWKPYRWLQNSLRYQFSDTLYQPQAAKEGYILASDGGSATPWNYVKNKMLSSIFTYDITVEPTDSILLLLSYSHAENYVRTLAASEPGTAANASATNPPYFPSFNSGYNTWLFSSTYSPKEYVTWTNTVSYTLSPNYVDYSTGLPLGSDFKELNLSTGIQWTWHKWLNFGPTYEYASYRDNSLSGSGNYSANIFIFNLKFDW